jgi:serine O-acetyltransferase
VNDPGQQSSVEWYGRGVRSHSQTRLCSRKLSAKWAERYRPTARLVCPLRGASAPSFALSITTRVHRKSCEAQAFGGGQQHVASDKGGRLAIHSWRRDMERNAQRRGRRQIPIAWIVSAGFRTVTLYRIIHWCYLEGKVPRFLGRLIFWYAYKNTACDIHGYAQIGEGFYLPHPLSIVIGEGTIIGDNVTIFQNVTLGKVSNESDGFPIVDDNAIIYSGAVVLGPIRVGKGARVAANAVVINDVPPNSVVGGIPARELRKAEPTKLADADRTG